MIYLTLLNIAVFQGLILSGIILRSSLFNSKANRYLAYIIITLSALIFNLVLDLSGILAKYDELQVYENIEYVFLVPVFLLFFILHKIDHPKKSNSRLKLLYIPFFYSVILNVFTDLEYILHLYKLSDKTQEIINIGFTIEHTITLLFLIGVTLYAYTFIKHEKDPKERRWLLKIWGWIFILLGTWVVLVVGILIGGYDISSELEVLALVATFSIHWMAYFGVFKYKLARDQKEIAYLLQKHTSKYNVTKETLLDDKASRPTSFNKENSYFKELESLCQIEDLYRDETLSREKVAARLDISPSYLSKIINTVSGKNFATYINDYRIEAVKKMLVDPSFEKYSLLAIGLESGFTSKTTFYTAFKKATGLTPNAYKKMHK